MSHVPYVAWPHRYVETHLGGVSTTRGISTTTWTLNHAPIWEQDEPYEACIGCVSQGVDDTPIVGVSTHESRHYPHMDCAP